MSFTQKERRQIDKNYFTIIRDFGDCYEVMSKKTKHLWIIKKTTNQNVDKYSFSSIPFQVSFFATSKK